MYLLQTVRSRETSATAVISPPRNVQPSWYTTRPGEGAVSRSARVKHPHAELLSTDGRLVHQAGVLHREDGHAVAEARVGTCSGGEGDRPLCVSYTTSPPADVVYATDDRRVPASVNISPPGGTFRQIEFVGILKGTEHRPLAELWVDYMLDLIFQEDIPLQMFVYPANREAQTPDVFLRFAEMPEDPVSMAPERIERNRERWILDWSDVMLR